MEQVYDTVRLDQGRYRFDHVLFIEEDHLVSPDILDSLQHMLHIVENERLPAVPGYHENKGYIRPKDIIGVAMYNQFSSFFNSLSFPFLFFSNVHLIFACLHTHWAHIDHTTAIRITTPRHLRHRYHSKEV